jgi:hypothetical protein
MVKRIRKWWSPWSLKEPIKKERIHGMPHGTLHGTPGQAGQAAKAAKIMIIRHAEKPAGKVAGVDETGASSSHHLSVRGWQRAGALACLFAPAQGPVQNALLAKPGFIFASAAATDPEPGDTRSRRSEDTVAPLAQLIGVDINLKFSKGQEAALAQAALACDGPVLIAWRHEGISVIANYTLGAEVAPQSWPKDRFDVIFVLTLNPLDRTYRFAQMGQRVLAGDSANPI